MNFSERPDWDEGIKVDLKSPAAIQSPTKWTGPEYPESIKRKYFGARPHMPFPTWIYHPTEKARMVSESEAAKYGITYRKATEDEQFRLHMKPEFYDCSGEWRTESYPKDRAFDPDNLQPGKVYVPRMVDHAKQQTALLEILARGNVDINNTEMKALQEQVAKMQALIEQLQPRNIQSTVEPEVTAEAHKNALADIWMSNPEAELEGLRNQAKGLGIKFDGRWGAKRLKHEIEMKAAT